MPVRGGSVCTAHPPSLESLRAEILQRTASVGLSGERRFTPHITVMKVPSKLPLTRIKPVSWRAGDFALVHSTITPEGSRYSVVERWPIQGGTAPSAAEQMSLL